ncbi:unnamed protein product, partial [Iphiclides podalirius]
MYTHALTPPTARRHSPRDGCYARPLLFPCSSPARPFPSLVRSPLLARRGTSPRAPRVLTEPNLTYPHGRGREPPSANSHYA